MSGGGGGRSGVGLVVSVHAVVGQRGGRVVSGGLHAAPFDAAQQSVGGHAEPGAASEGGAGSVRLLTQTHGTAGHPEHTHGPPAAKKNQSHRIGPHGTAMLRNVVTKRETQMIGRFQIG